MMLARAQTRFASTRLGTAARTARRPFCCCFTAAVRARHFCLITPRGTILQGTKRSARARACTRCRRCRVCGPCLCACLCPCACLRACDARRVFYASVWCARVHLAVARPVLSIVGGLRVQDCTAHSRLPRRCDRFQAARKHHRRGRAA